MRTNYPRPALMRCSCAKLGLARALGIRTIHKTWPLNMPGTGRSVWDRDRKGPSGPKYWELGRKELLVNFMKKFRYL